MNRAPRLCAVVPTYDNPMTVRDVVTTIRDQGLEVIVVDDGSGAAGRAACEALAADGIATLRRLANNGGKGAAVKAGFAAAAELGYSHVLQIDADGQHDLTRIAAFVDATHDAPDALILAYPEYGDDAPRLRRTARRFTSFWVDVEAGKGVIRDAMVGFRVYPLAAVRRLGRLGERMDFDIEIAVRLALLGTRVINLPVIVRYLEAEAGGVSHFQPFRDNLRFSWLHTRLCAAASFRRFLRLFGVGRK
ncbi:MAG: glycosyltransferase family 2 protein [Planctomycetes bacterium]|nr:glycosyltransferase family 2 protein [Planctomycetota bacterium]